MEVTFTLLNSKYFSKLNPYTTLGNLTIALKVTVLHSSQRVFESKPEFKSAVFDSETRQFFSDLDLTSIGKFLSNIIRSQVSFQGSKG